MNAAPGTPVEDLRRTAARVPDAVALVDGERRTTFGELAEAADAVAAGLAARGVRRGDRVVVALDNRTEMALAVYGVLAAGAVLVPLNPAMKAAKRRRLTSAAGAELTLGDAEEVAGLAGTRDAPPDPPAPEDLGALIYTSGSTGDPKGVCMAHRNMTFADASIVEYLGLTEADRVLCVLPLQFNYGLHQLFTCVRAGARLIVERSLAFPGRLIEALEREEATMLPGVPTVFGVLTGLKGLAERDLPHLRTITNAGAALPDSLLAALRRTFPGAGVVPMYGQTECVRVCALPASELDRRPGSVGPAIPGTEAWVEREDGTRAEPGEVGQLVTRGGHVMRGYFDNPEATARKLRPGGGEWERELLTGDLFRADEDGYLTFVARTDDIIKSRGEKVAPREVEEVLHAADGVGEVAVVGVEDELLGQAVVAHVAAAGGAELEPAALRRHCAERLEDHMVPRRVVVHDGPLPRNDNHKVDRRALAAWPAG